jgi:hypothetical protein
MSTNTQVPRFAVLQYQVLHELELSIPEYFLLDMIYHLSGSGSRWCNKKLENIAFDMRMSKRGVTDMRDRLIERKLLLKGVGNRLKTSEKVQKVYLLDESRLQKSAVNSEKVQKLHSKSAENVAKTPVENYKRITKKEEVVISKAQNPTFTDSEHASARKASDLIRERFGSKLGLKRHA